MAEVVILSANPGEEIRYCGALLAKYGQLDIKHEDRPFIVYPVISDYEQDGKFYSKQQQLDEIHEASEILGFNWEFIYEGRDNFRLMFNPNPNEEFVTELKNELERRFEFFNTKGVFVPLRFFNEISQVVFDIRKKFVLNLTYYGKQHNNNLFMEFNAPTIALKRKALLKMSSYWKNNVNLIDEEIEQNKKYGQYWNCKYAEAYYLAEGLIY